MEVSREASQEVKNRSTIWSSYSIWGHTPKELCSPPHTQIPVYACSWLLFTIDRKYNLYKCPLAIDIWIVKIFNTEEN